MNFLGIACFHNMRVLLSISIRLSNVFTTKIKMICCRGNSTRAAGTLESWLILYLAKQVDGKL